MRDLPSPWLGAPLWMVASSLPLLLCACPSPVDDDDTVEPDDPWVAEHTDLPGAALSIWGIDSDDVWVAGTGGDSADSAPLLLHRDGGSWEQLDTGEIGQAWWVVGDGDELIWVVGDGGLVLRYDRAADSFTRVTTDTNATLFGAWVAPSGVLFAVGGVIGSADEGPVLLRVEGDVATEVTGLPAGITNDENFFKVWGVSEDDLWIISDMGSSLHWDGALWAHQILEDAPRLVTVHGSGPDDVVVVGGASRATMFKRSGLAWEDISPAAGQSLNGVFVTADGGGFAAGFGNFMMERSGGQWTSVEGSLRVSSDWHGAWVDETGAPWVVGGNILRLTGGMVARRESE